MRTSRTRGHVVLRRISIVFAATAATLLLDAVATSVTRTETEQKIVEPAAASTVIRAGLLDRIIEFIIDFLGPEAEPVDDAPVEPGTW